MLFLKPSGKFFEIFWTDAPAIVHYTNLNILPHCYQALKKCNLNFLRNNFSQQKISRLNNRAIESYALATLLRLRENCMQLKKVSEK
jgi:hypothetical protein